MKNNNTEKGKERYEQAWPCQPHNFVDYRVVHIFFKNSRKFPKYRINVLLIY